MAETEPRSFLVPADRPLFGVLVEENGQEFVRYFTDRDALTKSLAGDSLQRALDLAGAWADLDWQEAADELDRIRHESTPTPPIEL